MHKGQVQTQAKPASFISQGTPEQKHYCVTLEASVLPTGEHAMTEKK
jgi:hypothetical protein